MPVDYKIYEDGLYVYARATGVLTPEEIIDYQRKIKQNQKVKRGYKVTVVKDAIKELPNLPIELIYESWKNLGVQFTTTAEVIKRK